MSQYSGAKPTVVVIGGGYGGITRRRPSTPTLTSCWSSRRTRSCIRRALRALVDPFLLPRIFLPYDRLLACGRVGTTGP